MTTLESHLEEEAEQSASGPHVSTEHLPHITALYEIHVMQPMPPLACVVHDQRAQC